MHLALHKARTTPWDHKARTTPWDHGAPAAQSSPTVAGMRAPIDYSTCHRLPDWSHYTCNCNYSCTWIRRGSLPFGPVCRVEPDCFKVELGSAGGWAEGGDKYGALASGDGDPGVQHAASKEDGSAWRWDEHHCGCCRALQKLLLGPSRRASVRRRPKCGAAPHEMLSLRERDEDRQRLLVSAESTRGVRESILAQWLTLTETQRR